MLKFSQTKSEQSMDMAIPSPHPYDFPGPSYELSLWAFSGGSHCSVEDLLDLAKNRTTSAQGDSIQYI
jgi:hypothetical protein